MCLAADGRLHRTDAIMIYANPPGSPAVPLVTAWDLDSFGWLQRGTVQDVMGFMSKVSVDLGFIMFICLSCHHCYKTVAERTAPTQRQSVQENSYVAHVHSRPASDGICGVLVSDVEYPGRVAFSLLNKTLDEFVMKNPRSTYDSKVNAITTGGAAQPAKGAGILPAQSFPQAQDYLTRYQDPRQADSIMRVQQELDETKIVLVSMTQSAIGIY